MNYLSFQNCITLDNIENLEKKTSDLRCNVISQRRKDDLFKRLKKSQEEKFARLRKHCETKYAYNSNNLNRPWNAQIAIFNSMTKTTVEKSLTNQDVEKLLPKIDLNDTIVDIYIKLIELKMIDPVVA